MPLIMPYDLFFYIKNFNLQCPFLIIVLFIVQEKMFIAMKKIVAITLESLQQFIQDVAIKFVIIGLYNKKFCCNKLQIF